MSGLLRIRENISIYIKYNVSMHTIQSLTSSSHLSKGYTFALISALFLSSTAPFIRHLTQTYAIPPLVLALWRNFFVLVTLLPILTLFRPALVRVSRPSLLYLAGYGLLLAGFNSLWTTSVALNGAAVATVLAYCSAAFAALLGWLILKERLDKAKILSIGLALIGCIFVAEAYTPTAWQSNLHGLSIGVLTGLAYAIYSLMGRSAAQRGLNPWTTLLYIFGFATFFLLIINLLPFRLLPGTASNPAELFWLKDSLSGWGIVFLLAIGPTIGGFGFYNVSLSYLPSSIVNLVATLEPAFTALIAYIFLNERLSLAQITGGLLIVSGVVFLRIYEDRITPSSIQAIKRIETRTNQTPPSG
ncbi:MAG: EamA/RhaT family transporter [Anaerolineae bacterium]|nr:MAG: EamA/RhaT family transporter [Anaerolineae bacterium]